MSFANRIAACPHCGMTVCFDGQGVCPSCGIDAEAPVVAADVDRIARVRDQATRERPTRDAPEQLSGWQTWFGIRAAMFLLLMTFGACRAVMAGCERLIAQDAARTRQVGQQALP